ncbi:hypothetical protein RQP46_005905 [Phenoliferia psychrophenolica]
MAHLDTSKDPSEASLREEAGGEKPTTTLREDVTAAGLEKVFERHGRIDLVPMPSGCLAYGRLCMTLTIGFHCMMGPFSAAAVIPAFESYVMDFGISITSASYLVSVPILFLGVSPLFWSPVSARIGRRPVYLASSLISAALHLAAAYCTTYGTLMTCRILQAIFLSPPGAIGAQSINEMFFQHEKGQKLGIWAWFFTIALLLHSGLYIFFGPETLYDRADRFANGSEKVSMDIEQPQSTSKLAPYTTFKRWGTTPWSRMPLETIAPLEMFLRLPVLLTTLAYAVAFSYSGVLLTVEIPALLGRKYDLNAQQVGLQFVAGLIGSALGEPLAGFGGDKLMIWRTRRANGQREPEMRLPISFIGFLLTMVGIVIFGIELENTAPLVWSVLPLIGCGIAFFGIQIVSTVAYTYAIESQTPSFASRVPLFIGFLRGLYAFTAPFYFNIVFGQLGAAKAGGLLGALAGGVGFITTILCIVFGRRWRQKSE